MSGLPQGADVTADRIALQGIRRTGRINENIPSILQYVCVADLRLMMLERRKRGSFGGRNVTQDHSKISIEVKNRGQQIKRAKLACIKDHLDSVCRQFQMWAITPRTSYNTMDELSRGSAYMQARSGQGSRHTNQKKTTQKKLSTGFCKGRLPFCWSKISYLGWIRTVVVGSCRH